MRKQSFFDSLQAMVERMPGFVFCTDLEQRFIAVNSLTLSGSGHSTLNSLLGTHYVDMKCPAAEMGSLFAVQDILALKKGTSVKGIGYCVYANNTRLLLLGEKKILKDEAGKVVGTISSFMDYTHCSYLNKANLLLDPVFELGVKKSFQIVYNFEPTYEMKYITVRESECLFYLMRGKSLKEIGRIMGISPRTVETHIDRLKYKFCSTNKSELIEKAIQKGFASIIPEGVIQQYFYRMQ